MTETNSTTLPVPDSLLNIVLRHEARATADEVRRMAYELQTFRVSHGQAPAGTALPEPEMHPVFPGGTPWPHYPNLQIGQRVRVHTGEEGIIESLRNSTKKYQVLIRPGYGGQYGAWEVTPITPMAESDPALDYPALPKAVTSRDTGSLLDKGRAITLLREYVDADRAAHKETFLHAAYYKWLREQHWSDSQMFVVTGGKESVKLGVVCPSGDRLDTMIAEAIAKEKEKQ